MLELHNFIFFQCWLSVHFPAHMLRFCICSKPVFSELGVRVGENFMLVIYAVCVLAEQKAVSCETRNRARRNFRAEGSNSFYEEESLQLIKRETDVARTEFKITARTCYPFATSLDGACSSTRWKGNRSRYMHNPFPFNCLAIPEEGMKFCASEQGCSLFVDLSPVLFYAGISNRNHLIQISASQKKCYSTIKQNLEYLYYVYFSDNTIYFSVLFRFTKSSLNNLFLPIKITSFFM